MDHYYEAVPGWAAFTPLYREMVERAPHNQTSTFVEIGSWLGKSAAYMGVEIINSGKPIMMTCIDPWVDGGPDLRDTEYFKALTKPPLDIFMENTIHVRDVITSIQLPSLSAAKVWPATQKINFLMIDGDHSYEACKADIAAWLPHMAEGGVISGDDYLWPGVTQAVQEAFKGGNIETRVRKEHEDYRKSVAYWKVQL